MHQQSASCSISHYGVYVRSTNSVITSEKCVPRKVGATSSRGMCADLRIYLELENGKMIRFEIRRTEILETSFLWWKHHKDRGGLHRVGGSSCELGC